MYNNQSGSGSAPSPWKGTDSAPSGFLAGFEGRGQGTGREVEKEGNGEGQERGCEGKNQFLSARFLCANAAYVNAAPCNEEKANSSRMNRHLCDETFSAASNVILAH